MNYRNIAVRTLTTFAETRPDMTLGQILYSILREGNSGAKDLKDLKKIDDEQLYSMIEKAKQFETE